VTQSSYIWKGRSNIQFLFRKKPVAVKESSESQCGLPRAVNMKTVVLWDVPVTGIVVFFWRLFPPHWRWKQSGSYVSLYGNLIKMWILSVGLYACQSWCVTLNYRCSRTNPKNTWMRREEVTVEWWELHDDERNDVPFWPHITGGINRGGWGRQYV
jgi:hypothetical protein